MSSGKGEQSLSFEHGNYSSNVFVDSWRGTK